MKRPRTRPYMMLASLLVALALVVGACGDSDTPDTTAAPTPTTEATTDTTAPGTTTPPATTTATEPAQAGGTLRMVVGVEPRSLNPAVATSRFDQQISRGIVGVLMEKDENNLPAATGLITGFEQVDPLTWRFTVRDDVAFHNGEPFNAEAAAFSLLANRDTGALGVYFKVFADATAIDSTTMEVTTTFPTGVGLVPALLTETFAYPPAYFTEKGPADFGLEPVGTGPLVFEEWRPGEFIRASANPDYWGGAPSLDGVEWTWAPDANTRLALLQTGDTDMTVTLSPQLFDDVEDDPNLELVVFPGGFKFFLGMNIEDPPLDDVRIRRAIALAIDRQGLVQGVLGGRGGVENPNAFHDFFGSSGLNADDLYTFDPAAASALVAEVAAEGEITPLQFNYTVGRYISDRDIGEALAGMVEAVGIPVVRNAQEPGEFLTALFTNTLGGTHTLPFDVRYPHEDVFMRTTFTSDGLVQSCKNDRLDELAQLGAAAPTEAARNEVFAEVERIVLIDLICWVSLFNQVDNFALSNAVQGFTARLDLQIDYEDLSLG